MILYIVFIVKGGFPTKVDYNYWLLIIFGAWFIASIKRRLNAPSCMGICKKHIYIEQPSKYIPNDSSIVLHLKKSIYVSNQLL